MNLAFRKITEEEFTVFRNDSLDNYMNELALSEGKKPEDFKFQTEMQFQHLLPQGHNSKNHHIYMVVDKNSDEVIGRLWFALKKGAQNDRYLFLYDIYLDKLVRGLGIGRRLMMFLEEQARLLEAKEIRLQVFGHNRRAKRFYDELGFACTSLTMKKNLP